MYYGVPLSRTPETTEDGIERLRAVARANPRSTTFVALAHALCDAGRPGEAESVCRDGLAQHPRLVTGQVALGRSLLEGDRLRESQEVLVEAVKANPEHADAFRWLAAVLLKRGDRDRARPLLEYAEELSPSDARIAELLLQAGGTPVAHPVRPSTDFEDTKVANARALADQMFDDRDALRSPPSGSVAALRRSGPPREEDPTVNAPVPFPAWPGEASPPKLPTAAGAPPSRDAAGVAIEPDPWSAPAFPRAASPEPPARAEEPSGQTNGAAAPPAAPRPTKWLVAGALAAASAVVAYKLLSPAPPPVAPSSPRGTPVAPAERASGGTHEGPEPLLPTAAPDVRRASIARALEVGSFVELSRARALAARAGDPPLDGDSLARVAFGATLLATDHGLATEREAAEWVKAAERAGGASSDRVALLHATRALLALGQGGLLPDARDSIRRAKAAAPELPEVLLAAGRVAVLSGDLPGARAGIRAAVERSPHHVPTVRDAARLAILSGKAPTAMKALEAALRERPGEGLLEVELGVAARAAARAGGATTDACRDRDGEPPAPLLRAACSLSESTERRLRGERPAARRAALAAGAEGVRDPWILSNAALALVAIGDVAAAESALRRGSGLASPTFPPLAWASAAVRLAKGEPVELGPGLEEPFSAEARLVAFRAAHANGGTAAAAALLRRLGSAAVAQDPELRTLSLLLSERKLAPADQHELETRVKGGDPVAAHVLGRLVGLRGDKKGAAKLLARALDDHAGACEALGALLDFERRSKRPVSGSPSLGALRERNPSCVHLPKPRRR